MKLKIECVRDVMEELESLPIGAHEVATLEKTISKHGREDVLYTVTKLSEASYINAEYFRTMDGRPHIGAIYDLTFSGHEFLNSIRTPGVWERIKGAAGEGGTACLKAIGDVAMEMLKEKLKSELSVKRRLFSWWT